ncbi:MAG: outer membrane protein assembly factor BamD [Planctomycetaceae bacterium]|nr:outer membrane protein assembly factor BamD [Planctomycetaceae bacterium]
MTTPHRHPAFCLLTDAPARAGRYRASAGLLMLLAICAGCQSTLDMSMLKLQDDDAVERMTDTGSVRGPLERILQTGHHAQGAGALQRPLEGDREYEKAMVLYKDGSYDEAQKEFKRLAKVYKDTAVGEDAQFMRAESLFALKRYSWAQDSYDQLFKDYPSTRHIDQSTRRLFHIARAWLQVPEMVTTSDIEQVNFDDPKAGDALKEQAPKSTDPTRRMPILPNLIDRSRPVFDTDGRALQALRSIWLHDPTGELADDAIMLSASYHLRKGDYAEANRFYTLLREEFPQSPHLEQAFVLGSHVELMSYQGPNYDGGNLERAEQLKESALKLYPDNPGTPRLQDELRKIDEAQARHDWGMVRFYWKKNKAKSVKIYAEKIIADYPTTTWADRARQVLAGASPREAEQGRQAVPEGGRSLNAVAEAITRPAVSSPAPAQQPATQPEESGSRFGIPRIPRLLPRLPSLRPIFGGGSTEDQSSAAEEAPAAEADSEAEGRQEVSTGGLMPRFRFPAFGGSKEKEAEAAGNDETFAPATSPEPEPVGRVRL